MKTIRGMMDLDRADFGTVEKDFADLTERILSNETLVKLMYFNTPNCLSKDETEITPDIIEEIAKENLRIVPSVKIPKNKGSYIIISFDSFMINAENPEYMDNLILIDILCPVDVWMMDSYMMRPFRMMHEIQKMLHGKPLNGIGKVHLRGANLLNLGDYNGYQMVFSVINDV